MDTEPSDKRYEKMRWDEPQECSWTGCDFETDWPAAMGKHKKAHQRKNALKMLNENHPWKGKSKEEMPFYLDPPWECPEDGCDFSTDWAPSRTVHEKIHDGTYEWKGGINPDMGKPLDETWHCPIEGCDYVTPYVMHKHSHQARHAKDPDYRAVLPSKGGSRHLNIWMTRANIDEVGDDPESLFAPALDDLTVEDVRRIAREEARKAVEVALRNAFTTVVDADA